MWPGPVPQTNSEEFSMASVSSDSPRRFTARALMLPVALVAALFLPLLSGCAEEEEVDPYVYGTLVPLPRLCGPPGVGPCPGNSKGERRR